jgi:hypothetical protein
MDRGSEESSATNKRTFEKAADNLLPKTFSKIILLHLFTNRATFDPAGELPGH